MWFSRPLMPDDIIIISGLVRVLYLVGFALYILRYRLLGRPFVESLFCDETSWTRAVSWRFSWFFFWFLCCGFHFRSLHVVVRSFCIFWCLSARCSACHMLYLTVPRSLPWLALADWIVVIYPIVLVAACSTLCSYVPLALVRAGCHWWRPLVPRWHWLATTSSSAWL